MKNIVVILICLSLLIVPIAGTTKENTGTLSFTQSDYVKQYEELKSLKSISDIIQSTLELYLTVSKAKRQSFDKYDSSIFTSKTNNNLGYRMDCDKYYSTILNESGKILYDKIWYSDFKIHANKSEELKDSKYLTASIIEYYQFFVDDEFQKLSSTVKEYTFTLEYIDMLWKIVEIKTNDPNELNRDFEYIRFDGEKLAKSVLKVSEYDVDLVKKDMDNQNTVSYSKAWYRWYCDDYVLQDYAETYVHSVNPTFGSSPEDCQNFVSQCLWAGFAGLNSPETEPAVSRPNYGTDPRVWERNKAYVNAPYGYGWNWDNTDAFTYMIGSSTGTTEGLRGSVYFGNVNLAEIGDVIQIASSSSPTYSSIYHAMVVTEVTGTWSARNPDNLYVAAHNSPTSSAYQKLSLYMPYPESYFTTVRIYDGYYSLQQYYY